MDKAPVSLARRKTRTFKNGGTHPIKTKDEQVLTDGV